MSGPGEYLLDRINNTQLGGMVPVTEEEMQKAKEYMGVGRKDDSGKLRFDLIPGYPLSLLADVYTRGAKKYADRNWEKGIQYSRIFAAMMRHAWKWFCGERLDEVDGQHHLASVAWCAFALMEYEQTRPEFDDRPRKTKLGIAA